MALFKRALMGLMPPLLMGLFILVPTATASASGLTKFYVDPNNQAHQYADSIRATDPSDAAIYDRIGNQAQADWIDNGGNDEQTVTTIEAGAAATNTTAVIVLYEIPGRDCGSYSAGGYGNDAAYEAYVNNIAAGAGTRPTWFIIEPDALGLLASCGFTAAQQQDRLNLLTYASKTLSALPGAHTYLDAGNAYFTNEATIVPELQQAGVAYDSGFSLDVSNFDATAHEESYAATIQSGLGGVHDHYVIDTSRNGNGTDNTGGTDAVWCNPPGRALGHVPHAIVSATGDDADLWVKAPGASDGTCNGAPQSGVFWPAYAKGLVEGDS